jgi:cysteine desulfurase/selenocysteine lyase
VRFDPERLRHDFPALHQEVHGKPLVYLDNAATTQKPQAVLDAIGHYFKFDNANVHRGAHLLSERATRAFEDARVKVQHFLNAAQPRRSSSFKAPEGINLVAQSYGRSTSARRRDRHLAPRAPLQHRSLADPVSADQGRAQVAPIDDRGEILFEEYEAARPADTNRLHRSCLELLGTINPAKRIVTAAHRSRAVVLLDALSRAAPESGRSRAGLRLYAFSAQLAGRPSIGVVRQGEAAGRDATWQGGGDMIRSVSFAGTTYNDLQQVRGRHPHIAGAVGLERRSITSPRSASRPPAPTNSNCWPMPPRPLPTSRACAWSARRLTRPQCCRSSWTNRRWLRSTSAPGWTWRASRFARDITAASPSWTASASPEPCGHHWP